MAKLEFYRQQVAPNLVTPSGAGIAEAGRSTAQAIQAVQSLTDTAAQMFERLDTVKAEDAFNKLRETQTKLMMDPNEGFLSKKSADAVSADFMRKYVDDFDKSIEETASGLQNERQRDLFKRRAAAANAQYQSTLRNHVLNETDAYNKQTFEGVVKTESAAAATTYNDPASVALSLDRIRNNAVNYANSAGIKGDAQVALVNASLAEAHNSILAAAVGNNNFGFVKEYMKQFDKGGKYEGQLGAERTAQLKNSIETADTRDASLKLSLELADKKLSFSSQRKQLDDMYRAGKITADVANETEFNNSMSGRAQEWILQNPGKPIVDMPPNLYNWAKGKGQLQTLSNFATNNGNVQGDDAEFTRLFVMSADDPTAFMREFDQNSESLRTVLSASQYNSLLTRRGSAGKADLQGQQAAKVSAATIKSLRNNLISAGIDVTPKEGTPQATELANFESQLIQAIVAKTEQEGRALTLNETRKIGLDLLREGRLINSGGFWSGDTKLRRFEATEADMQRYGFRYNYADIPPEDQKRLYRIIQTRPDVRDSIGITLTPNKTITSDDFARGIEILYSAELDGVTF